MLRHTLLSLALCLSAAVASAADMGPLNPLLTPGQDGDWILTDEGETILLENPSAPGAIQFYWAGGVPNEAGSRTITVDVGHAGSSGQALAGILYGYIGDPRSYFLYTVGGDGNIYLHFFEPGTFDQVIKTEMDGINPSRVTLEIVEEDKFILLRANGQKVAEIESGRFGQGDVGIVAADQGAFRFGGFQITSPFR